MAHVCHISQLVGNPNWEHRTTIWADEHLNNQVYWHIQQKRTILLCLNPLDESNSDIQILSPLIPE